MREAPRCGRPMRPTRLQRPRLMDDDDPVCGRPAGHRGGCLSEEVWARNLRYWSRPEALEARRRLYAEARAKGLPVAEAKRYAGRGGRVGAS